MQTEPEMLHELHALAIGAASRVQPLLARSGQQISTTWKTNERDLVSEIDRRIEQIIARCVLEQRPDDSFIAEEGTRVAGSSAVTWIVDPIDGTLNFLRGLPGFTVSIAAELEGRTVTGVILDPVRNELFSALYAHGAWRSESPIHCSSTQKLSRALVATGFSSNLCIRDAQASTLRSLLGQVHDVRSAGGAAYELCQVACGRTDGYYESGLQTWDVKAGALIAAEAGCEVSLDAKDAQRLLICAANPSISGPLKQLTGFDSMRG